MEDHQIEPLDLDVLNLQNMASVAHKVHVSDLAPPVDLPGSGRRGILEYLPDILAGQDFKQVVRAIRRARAAKKPVIAALGGHVIKCGLGPTLSGLVRDGHVTWIAMNGAAAIHDLELAWFGETSEFVESGLRDGHFGISRETGARINHAVSAGIRRGLGLGASLLQAVAESPPKHRAASLICSCCLNRVPVTLHPALGTDTVHVHPGCDWSAWGQGAYRDFRLLASAIAGLNGGGVHLNIGSAVILPEVFLKALNAARNIKPPVTDFTTVDMDLETNYRSLNNVVQRPNDGSHGFSIQGRHEIMLPLLAVALAEERDV